MTESILISLTIMFWLFCLFVQTERRAAAWNVEWEKGGQ